MHLRASLAQHPLANSDDLSRLLQHRNELIRRHQALSLPPTQQSLHAHHLRTPGRHLDDRLVVKLKLVTRQGFAQGIFQVQPLGRLFLQALVVERQLALAEGLGPVQRQVSLAQGVLLVTAPGQRRHTNADADSKPARPRNDGVLQGVHDAFADQLGIQRLGHIVQQHDKLITTKAPQMVAGPQAALDTLGDLNQHLIPGLMPEAFVDQLEAIQIDKQHRRMPRPWFGLPLQRLTEQLANLLTVR